MRGTRRWFQPAEGPRGRAPVLLIAAEPARRDRLKALVRSAGGVPSVVSIQCASQVPPGPLDRYALVLVDGVDRPDARLEPVPPGRVGGVVILVEGRAATTPAVAFRLAQVQVPVVLWGTPAEDERARGTIAEHLFAAPAMMHLDPVLERICTPEQRQIIGTFLARVGACTPGKVAGSVARSRRSLARDCQEVGLASPRTLLRTARVTRSLAWIHTHGGGATHAARAGGYADVQSWRRAARLTFGVGPEVLLADWEDEEALAERYGTVLLRG